MTETQAPVQAQTDVRGRVTRPERPLLAHRHEVRAAMEGRLGLVVRPMKPQPDEHWGTPCGQPEWYTPGVVDRHGELQPAEQDVYGVYTYDGEQGWPCPFGAPGDVLWCKETFWVQHETDSDDYSIIDCGPDLSLGPKYCRVQYCATPENPADPDRPGDWWYGPPDGWDGESLWERSEDRKEWCPWGKLHGDLYTKYSSAIMPRWASRLSLEVTEVRVGQLKTISPSEALAAGADRWDNFRMYLPSVAGSKPVRGPLGAFAQVWESTYGKALPWDPSTWVWLVGVRRVQP